MCSASCPGVAHVASPRGRRSPGLFPGRPGAPLLTALSSTGPLNAKGLPVNRLWGFPKQEPQPLTNSPVFLEVF